MTNDVNTTQSDATSRRDWLKYLAMAVVVVVAAGISYTIGRYTAPVTDGPSAPQASPAPTQSPKPAAPSVSPGTAPNKAASGQPALDAPKKKTRKIVTKKGGFITIIKEVPIKDGDNALPEQTKAAGPDPQTVSAEVMADLSAGDPRVRADAIKRLADLDDPAVNAPLSMAVRDPNWRVQEAAAEVMASIASPNIFDSLAEGLAFGDKDTRGVVLETLEEMQVPEAVDIVIEKGLTNDNADIQEDASYYIKGLADQEFESYQEARQWWDQNKASFQFDQ